MTRPAEDTIREPGGDGEHAAVGMTYQGRPRTWGLRLSKLDVVVLLASALATVALWRSSATYVFLADLVVLHFFLFCNVFRIPRKPELVWSGGFLVICTACLVVEADSPRSLGLCVAPWTIAILSASIRAPSYHGIFADRINPRLPDYLAGRPLR